MLVEAAREVSSQKNVILFLPEDPDDNCVVAYPSNDGGTRKRSFEICHAARGFAEGMATALDLPFRAILVGDFNHVDV